MNFNEINDAIIEYYKRPISDIQVQLRHVIATYKYNDLAAISGISIQTLYKICKTAEYAVSFENYIKIMAIGPNKYFMETGLKR